MQGARQCSTPPPTSLCFALHVFPVLCPLLRLPLLCPVLRPALPCAALPSAMLCSTSLCYAVQCFPLLPSCCASLCYAVLRFPLLCCAALYLCHAVQRPMPCCAVLPSVPRLPLQHPLLAHGCGLHLPLPVLRQLVGGSRLAARGGQGSRAGAAGADCHRGGGGGSGCRQHLNAVGLPLVVMGGCMGPRWCQGCRRWMCALCTCTEGQVCGA